MEAKLLEIELPLLGSGNNPRSEGLHLTDVIRDLQKVAGIEPVAPAKWNRASTMGAGFIWEEVLAQHWEDMFSQALAKLLARKLNWYSPGELHLDGITGTPDGLDVADKGYLILQEAKFTWKSIKSTPADIWAWMVQTKSYLHMLNHLHVSQPQAVIFHVYHCMGDYRGSGPIYRPWQITFQPHELEENWEMICNHAELMRSRN